MAITQSMATSFKVELLKAVHNFSTGGNTFKLALYTSSATMGATTTAYTTTNEVTGTNYTAKGDPNVAVFDFGGDKTSTAGSFTIQFPAKAASTAVIRIA